VTAVHQERAAFSIQIAGGLRLTAQHLVVATNSPIHDTFALHTKQAPYRSYVLGFSTPPGALPKALYWDTLDPYHYVRWAGASTLLVGGEDHRVGLSAHPEERWDALEGWARRALPELGAVTSRWSGQILEPADGLAFIGKNPGLGDRSFVVTGDSGNGITHGALAGLLIRDLIAGSANGWAAVYDPSRKPDRLPSLKEYLAENAKVAVAYTDWLKPAARPDESIERGAGAVIQRGTHKVAVYVDEQGTRHECSAVCPHLAGVVSWNAAERSWDCPCHGSRFDPFGHVMNGPAHTGLTRLEPAEPRARGRAARGRERHPTSAGGTR
jgi:Rieske Fe-S protein